MESIICLPCPDTTEQFKTESNENNTEIQSFKFICPKGCGYGANYKYQYNFHLNRKKDCTPVPKGSKRCSKCNEVKNKMDFYKGQSPCKICSQISIKKCKHTGCGKQPHYGYDGKATHCSIHKQPDMESNIKTCKHPGCRTHPSFGHDGKATHCSIHKQPDMESTSKTCAHSGCGTRPSFGHNGKATHCSIHKQPDMESTSKKCEHPGCGIQPHYGYDGKATHCVTHKQPDMESTSKKCEHPGCGIQPFFGHDGKATHCSIHKQPDMEYTRKTCEYPGCRTQPSFGHNGKPTHCSIHKQPDMESTNKTCLSEWCDTRVTTNKYDGYCTHCFKNLKPNDPRMSKIRSKTKEELVREFINEHFEDFVHDKPIEYGGCVCSMRRRVDHRKLVKGTMLAIETDEFQHKSYEAQEEEIRYDDLFIGGHSGKWIFIRFNPDGYTDSKGKKRKGMLQANGNRNSEEVKRRLTYLKEQINKQIKRIECDENTEIFEIHKLFYDENLEHI